MCINFQRIFTWLDAMRGERAMNVETLDDLFHQELRELYGEEKRLVEALPKMARGSSSALLREARRLMPKRATWFLGRGGGNGRRSGRRASARPHF